MLVLFVCHAIIVISGDKNYLHGVETTADPFQSITSSKVCLCTVYIPHALDFKLRPHGINLVCVRVFIPSSVQHQSASIGLIIRLCWSLGQDPRCCRIWKKNFQFLQRLGSCDTISWPICIIIMYQIIHWVLWQC